MKCQLTIFLIACSSVTLIAGNDELPYIFGMQRLLVKVSNSEQFNLVVAHEGDPDFDFMRIPLSEPIDVLVTADRVDAFKRELSQNGIEFEVVVEDLSKVFGEEEESNHRAKRNLIDDWPNVFLSYIQIANILVNLVKKYPDFISPLNLGYSSQKRSLIGLKFSRTCSCNRFSKPKPALFIDAGIHAREWLAPSTALYAAEQLAKPENRYLFEDVDIYIVPLLNPDGYQYSRLNSTTRLWRKTRSNDSTVCPGVDANRNFDIDWNNKRSSSNPCSHLYAGPHAFSEPETRALRDFLWQHRDTIKVYLSLHSYGKYLLYPWGYTKRLPTNVATLSCVAKTAVSALAKVRGTWYREGTSANVIYEASGGSDDWAMGVAGIDLAYTMELPGDARTGFQAPTREIIPVGRETFEAFKVFVNYIKGGICQNLTKQESHNTKEWPETDDDDNLYFSS